MAFWNLHFFSDNNISIQITSVSASYKIMPCWGCDKFYNYPFSHIISLKTTSLWHPTKPWIVLATSRSELLLNKTREGSIESISLWPYQFQARSFFPHQAFVGHFHFSFPTVGHLQKVSLGWGIVKNNSVFQTLKVANGSTATCANISTIVSTCEWKMT